MSERRDGEADGTTSDSEADGTTSEDEADGTTSDDEADGTTSDDEADGSTSDDGLIASLRGLGPDGRALFGLLAIALAGSAGLAFRRRRRT